MNLKGDLPKDFDFTAPERFIESMGLDKADGYNVDMNFYPGRSIFEEECRPYGVNWLVMFCVSCILDNFFDDSNNYNFFAVPGRKFRSRREGVRLGLAYVFEKGVPETVKELEPLLGASLEARALEVFNKLLAFEKGEKVEFPEPLPTMPPEVYEPEIPPSPIEEKPQPKPEEGEKGEGGRPGWKNVLLKIAGVLGGLGFLVSLFLPGWAKQALDLVLKLIDLIAK